MVATSAWVILFKLEIPFRLVVPMFSIPMLQGVTGFGSSIALLSTWVVSRAIGVRACESSECYCVHSALLVVH